MSPERSNKKFPPEVSDRQQINGEPGFDTTSPESIGRDFLAVYGNALEERGINAEEVVRDTILRLEREQSGIRANAASERALIERDAEVGRGHVFTRFSAEVKHMIATVLLAATIGGTIGSLGRKYYGEIINPRSQGIAIIKKEIRPTPLEQDELTLDEKKELEAMQEDARRIKDVLGEYANAYIDQVLQGLSPAELRAWLKTPENVPRQDSTVITGAERVGLSNESVKQFLLELVPPRALASSSTIEIGGEHPTYAGEAYFNKDIGRYGLRVYRDNFDWSMGINQPILKEVFAHEVGHNIDHRTNPYLSVRDRIKLHVMILDRLTADDRLGVELNRELGSAGVKDLRAKSPEAVWSGAVEYWATIFQRYITGTSLDGGPVRLSQKDIDLVRWVLERTDPEWLKQNDARRLVPSRRL